MNPIIKTEARGEYNFYDKDEDRLYQREIEVEKHADLYQSFFDAQFEYVQILRERKMSNITAKVSCKTFNNENKVVNYFEFSLGAFDNGSTI